MYVCMYVCATGDSSLSSPDSKANVDHHSAFFSCAEQIEAFATEDAKRRLVYPLVYLCMYVWSIVNCVRNQPYEKVLWFLASDSKALRNAAVERL